MDKNFNLKKLVVIFVIVLAGLIAAILVYQYLTQGTLAITSDPSPANINVGKKSYKSPVTIKLGKGSYTISANLENLPAVTQTVEIKARQTQKLFFDLTSTQPESQPAGGLSADDPVFTIQEHFQVAPPKSSEKDCDLVITLFATLNGGILGPSQEQQLQEYNQQLKDYKQEALKWLIDNNVSEKDYKIKWIPDEAANL